MSTALRFLLFLYNSTKVPVIVLFWLFFLILLWLGRLLKKCLGRIMVKSPVQGQVWSATTQIWLRHIYHKTAWWASVPVAVCSFNSSSVDRAPSWKNTAKFLMNISYAYIWIWCWGHVHMQKCLTVSVRMF